MGTFGTVVPQVSNNIIVYASVVSDFVDIIDSVLQFGLTGRMNLVWLRYKEYTQGLWKGLGIYWRSMVRNRANWRQLWVRS